MKNIISTKMVSCMGGFSAYTIPELIFVTPDYLSFVFRLNDIFWDVRYNFIYELKIKYGFETE